MSYYEFVADRLRPVKDDPEEIMEKMQLIRNELLEGRLEIGNIK